jgi:hypothetical protein
VEHKQSHDPEEFPEAIPDEISQTATDEVLTNNILEDVKQKNSEIVEETSAFKDDQPTPENSGSAGDALSSGENERSESNIVRSTQDTNQVPNQDVVIEKAEPKGKTDEELIAEHLSDMNSETTTTYDVNHDLLQDGEPENSDVVSIDGFTDIDKSHSYAVFTDELEKTLDNQMKSENEAAQKLAKAVQASKIAKLKVESVEVKSQIVRTEVTKGSNIDDVSRQSKTASLKIGGGGSAVTRTMEPFDFPNIHGQNDHFDHDPYTIFIIN